MTSSHGLLALLSSKDGVSTMIPVQASQVGPRFHHQCGCRMAKKMTSPALRDADLQQILFDLARQLIGMNRAALARDKQIRHAAVDHKVGDATCGPS